MSNIVLQSRSNTAALRVRYLLELLKAKELDDERWRMPRGWIVYGRLEDFVRSVDCVKQLEGWIAAEETRKFGYSEFFLEVSFHPPHWDAVVHDAQDREIACSNSLTESETLARIEALINYVKATGLAKR